MIKMITRAMPKRAEMPAERGMNGIQLACGSRVLFGVANLLQVLGGNGGVSSGMTFLFSQVLAKGGCGTTMYESVKLISCCERGRE